MESVKPSHIYTEIVLETFKLSGLLSAEGDRLSAPLDLTSARWKILGALARSDIPMTVPQIARSMGQTRQTVQNLVNILAEAGLVEFQINPNHKRARLVVLTVAGAEKCERMESLHAFHATQRAEKFPVESLKTTLQTLREISFLLQTGALAKELTKEA